MTKIEFDNIIRENLETIHGKGIFGYNVPTGKTYPNYYSNDSFGSFCSEMKEKHNEAYTAYAEGAGSELEGRNGRYGIMPPKMASIGSSSRFCYLALRNGAAAIGGTGKVTFEYGCPIDGITGMAPQLDAFVEDDAMFFEVKCHEIFDKHCIVMKRKYWSLVCGSNNQFGLKAEKECNQDVFNIPLSVFGIEKESSMFDIKQLLCHLLGVASFPGDGKDKRLVYLFFKPIALSRQEEIDQLFADLKSEIETIFASNPIQKFCQSNRIELQAFAEEAEVMQSLTLDTIKVLYA